GAAYPGRAVAELPPAVPDAQAVLAERDLDAILVQGERDGAVADPARALVRAHRQEHLLPADLARRDEEDERAAVGIGVRQPSNRPSGVRRAVDRHLMPPRLG